MMFLFGMVSCFIIVRLDYRIEHNTIESFTALVFNIHFDICLAILFQELNNYFAVTTSTSVIVDKSSDGDFLRIDFNFR